MINCPHCGASNKEESKFCGSCGQPLDVVGEAVCPMCGTGNPPESTICSQCGARLARLAAPPSEEQPEPVEEEAVAIEDVEGEKAPPEPTEVAEAEEMEEVTAVSEGELGEPMPPWLEKLRDLPAEEVPVEAEEGARLVPAELPGPVGEEAAPEPTEVAEAEEMEEVTAVSEGELEEPMPPWLAIAFRNRSCSGGRGLNPSGYPFLA